MLLEISFITELWSVCANVGFSVQSFASLQLIAVLFTIGWLSERKPYINPHSLCWSLKSPCDVWTYVALAILLLQKSVEAEALVHFPMEVLYRGTHS